MHNRLVPIVMVLAVGAVIAFVLVFAIAPDTAEPVSTLSPLARRAGGESRNPLETEPRSSHAPSFSLEPGVAYAYRYRSASTTTADYPVLSERFAAEAIPFQTTGKHTYCSDCRGTFLVRVCGRQGDDWVLGARLQPETHALDGVETHLLEALGQPFAFRLRADGRIAGFSFPPGIPEEVQGAIGQIVRSFQVVLPERDQRGWTSREEDANGTYEAAYALRGDWQDAQLRIHKSRRAYVEPVAPSADGVRLFRDAAVTIESSGIDAEWSAQGGWIHEIEGKERLSVRLGDDPWAETESSFFAERVEVPAHVSLPGDVEELRATMASTGFLTRSLYVPPPRAIRDGLEGRLPDALAFFHTLLARDLEVAEATMVGYLRLHPEACRDLVDVLDRSTAAGDDVILAERSRLKLWRLVAETGHAEAQDALVQAAANPEFTDETRLHAISALFAVAHPVARTAEDLLELHRALSGTTGSFEREVESSSLFALGALGHHERADLDLGRSIAEDLRGELALAGDERSVILALDAIGNHGGATLLEDVRARLADARSDVRVAAYRALRRMRGEAVEEVFTEALAVEASLDVRVAALRVLVKWEPSEITARWARRRLGADLSAQEALPLIDFLGASMDRFPANETALRVHLATVPPVAVRHRIYQYIPAHVVPAR